MVLQLPQLSKNIYSALTVNLKPDLQKIIQDFHRNALLNIKETNGGELPSTANSPKY